MIQRGSKSGYTDISGGKGGSSPLAWLILASIGLSFLFLVPTLVFSILSWQKTLSPPASPPPCEIGIPLYPNSSILVPGPVVGQPIALVTGASRGIGRATAELFKSLGYFVIGTSRAPAGPFTFPRYIPPSAPNVDVMLPFDQENPATFAAFLFALDTVLAGPGGNRPLSAIVLNVGRFYYGTFAGTLLKEYGITPYNNDPFPPGPGAWAAYNAEVELVSTNPTILLTQLLTWPPLNASLTTRINPLAGIPRIVTITSAESFLRTTPFVSAYMKKALRAQIDSLRVELDAISPAFSALPITQIHPSAIDTSLYRTTAVPGVGPVVGDVELIQPAVQLWESLTGGAITVNVSDVAKAIVQTVQMVSPPAEAFAITEGGLVREYLACIHKQGWCAGTDSGIPFEALMDEEVRSDVLVALSNPFTSDCLGPGMGIREPQNYQTLPATSYTLVFHSFNMPPNATTWEVSINGLTFVPVACTSVASVAAPNVYIWTSTAPFDFSAHSGSTVTFTVRAVSAGLVDQVNALIVKTIHVIIP